MNGGVMRITIRVIRSNTELSQSTIPRSAYRKSVTLSEFKFIFVSRSPTSPLQSRVWAGLPSSPLARAWRLLTSSTALSRWAHFTLIYGPTFVIKLIGENPRAKKIGEKKSLLSLKKYLVYWTYQELLYTKTSTLKGGGICTERWT